MTLVGRDGSRPMRKEGSPPALTGSTAVPGGGGNCAHSASIAARRSESEMPSSAEAKIGAQYWVSR